MMKLLIFGKTGQVGRALASLGDKDLQITSLGREDADLTIPDQCASQIRATDADAVINVAAYTAVDRAEAEVAMATQINAIAPGVMAAACAEKGVPFLHVSTDYVFDGCGDTAFTTDHPAQPINAYGHSKWLGEEHIRAAGGCCAILRTSWVFSEHGANFVKTMLGLAKQHPSISVVDDQVGGPTPALDIAKALVVMARAMVAGQCGGTYHFAGQPVISWAGFAREVFAEAQHQVEVKPIPTSQYPTPAQRPLNSRLDCADVTRDFGLNAPDWRLELKRVVKVLKRG